MARMQCRTCEGVYETVQRDGVQYFHACPPLSHVRVTRAGVERDVPHSDLRPTDLITVQRAGAVVELPALAAQPGDQRLGDTFIDRPDKRDENVKIVDYDKAGNAITAPKSEGAGTSPAPAK